MNKIYKLYCKAEEALVGMFFIIIVALTFMNAVLRLIGSPIIYADDICMLLFSWTALMGADVAMRFCRLVGMDIVTSKLPPKVQKVIGLVVQFIMIAMRYCRLVGMDIVTSKLPAKVQKVIGLVVQVIMIAMLVVLIKGGIKIVNLNGNRPFNTLESFGIRYGAVTTAIPVCCSMMILTCVTKIYKLITHINDDEFTLKKDASDAKLGEENMGVGETPVEL